MSGHNRWSKLKHKKAATDAKKSKGWTKLLKEVSVAAKSGGGDPAGNPRLRSAIDKARADNVPNDTIERSIKKGTGELEAEQIEELTYQAFAPGGVALIIEAATDNRNRTGAEIRKMLERQNAKIDSSGSVLHKFKRRGQLVFDATKLKEDDITEVALDQGADDVRADAEAIVVLTEPGDLHAIKDAFEKKGMVPDHAEVVFLPELPVSMSADEAEGVEKLIGLLDEHDDVMNVYSNHEVVG